MKEKIFETLETVHTDITLTEKLNKFVSITELSSVICHEIKEYAKN